jgi:hypothetical protein
MLVEIDILGLKPCWFLQIRGETIMESFLVIIASNILGIMDNLEIGL